MRNLAVWPKGEERDRERDGEECTCRASIRLFMPAETEMAALEGQAADWSREIREDRSARQRKPVRTRQGRMMTAARFRAENSAGILTLIAEDRVPQNSSTPNQPAITRSRPHCKRCLQ